jgi:hypothetical protein
MLEKLNPKEKRTVLTSLSVCAVILVYFFSLNRSGKIGELSVSSFGPHGKKPLCSSWTRKAPKPSSKND